MKKRISRFTLVEMLTVIAILAILAGIITPVVIIARQRGRITDAQSDISSMMTALKAMDSDYGEVLDKKDGKYYTSGATLQEVTVNSDNVAAVEGNAYNAFITELTAPKNGALEKVAVNKRKKTYLDPRQEFDPSANYTGQTEQLYRDPWGNPYKILIKVTAEDDGLKVYKDYGKTISGKFAIYSFGPDGKDGNGCNADFRICGDDDCDHDDIASWNL